MANPFCFVELHTGNTEGAKSFYGTLFGWKIQEMMLGKLPYAICHVGEGTPGGITGLSKGDRPHWLAFIEVDDIDSTLARASKMGAKTLQGRTEIPGFGEMARIMDPTGAEVGIWKRG